MRIINLTGDNYTIGKALGKKFCSSIKYRIKQFKINKRLIQKKKKYLIETEKICHAFPNYLNELKGISHGAKINFYEILMLNLLGLLDINRCSTLAMKGKKNFIAHNEDGDSFERKKDFSLIRYKKEDFFFYTFFYPGELMGSTFSWNSYGLIITVNSIRSKLSSKPKLPRVFISRALLEAKSINHALNILKKSKSSGGLHYLLMQNKKIISVEQYQNKISIEKVKGIFLHTNHYLHKRFYKKTTPRLNSLVRYNRLKEMIKKNKKEILNADKKTILKIMRDRKTKPHSIYNKKGDENQTLATFVAIDNKKYVL